MGFIAHYRGHLRDYLGPFQESLLLREVTLDDFLAERYPPFLLEKFPEQARADREKEWAEITSATLPGDTLWLWRRFEFANRTDGSWSECGGLAICRAAKVVRVWLVWEDH
jgi:hypothetical protein